MRSLFGLGVFSSTLVPAIALAVGLDVEVDVGLSIGLVNSSLVSTCQTVESSVSSASGVYYFG